MALDESLSVFDRDALYQARKRALLKEAGYQFTAKGFAGTSLDSVAKNLKLTKAGLYHYVRSKEELLYLCYKDAIEFAERAMESVSRMDCKAPDKIAAYIKAHLAAFDQPSGFFIILAEFYSLSEEHQHELKDRARTVDRHLRKFIEEGVKEGSIADCDPSLVVFAIQGALNWIPKWYSRGGNHDIDEISDAFIEFFKMGLLKR